jgi:hypothetical protein
MQCIALHCIAVKSCNDETTRIFGLLSARIVEGPLAVDDVSTCPAVAPQRHRPSRQRYVLVAE